MSATTHIGHHGFGPVAQVAPEMGSLDRPDLGFDVYTDGVGLNRATRLQSDDTEASSSRRRADSAQASSSPAQEKDRTDQPPGPFFCNTCARQFVRYCDLNKHSKTHSRPFKCSVPDCKYNKYGWPTEKELERHHNDKHSSSPRTFNCRFQDCSYKSKRESNCKQHMEKTHGWEYVRSRSSKAYRCPYPDCSFGCQEPEETEERHAGHSAIQQALAAHGPEAPQGGNAGPIDPTSSRAPTDAPDWDEMAQSQHQTGAHAHTHAHAHRGAPTMHTVHTMGAMGAMGGTNNTLAHFPVQGADFTLYPGEIEMDAALLGASGQGLFRYGSPNDECEGGMGFVPWSSPETRIRNNVEVLRQFSQSYSYAAEREDVKRGESMMLDPHLDTRPLFPIMTQVDPPHGSGRPPAGTHLHEPTSTPTTVIKESASPASFFPIAAPQWTPPTTLSKETQTPTSIMSTCGTTAAKRTSGGATTTVRVKRSIDEVSRGGGETLDNDDNGDSDKDDDGRDDENEDDEPERKKIKYSPDDDFDDSKMPCPFQLANPEFYKLERNSKFIPCHTSHSQISTIVRHMKRKAHKLKVADFQMSSFDVPQDDESRHPAAGLCRRCWRSFTARDEFAAHFLTECAAQSRSKREKFRALYDTFCVKVAPENGASGSGQASASAPGRSTASAVAQRPPQAASEEPPIRVKTDATAGEAPRSSVTNVQQLPQQPPQQQQQQLDDFLALTERVKALEQSNKELRVLATITLLFITQQKPDGGNAAHATTAAAQQQQRRRRPSDQASTARRRTRGAYQDRERSVAGVAASASEQALTQVAATGTDKESLVGGMDSQSTDVDRDGFIPEAQRTLTGLSSTSTDRSTVRHVPLSPHTRFEDLPEDEEAAAGAGAGGQASGTQAGGAGAATCHRGVGAAAGGGAGEGALLVVAASAAAAAAAPARMAQLKQVPPSDSGIGSEDNTRRHSGGGPGVWLLGAGATAAAATAAAGHGAGESTPKVVGVTAAAAATSSADDQLVEDQMWQYGYFANQESQPVPDFRSPGEIDIDSLFPDDVE